jgi:alpha-beta hydrolase superfamily lysophospholipase
MRLAARTPLRRMRYPMTLASKMTGLVNNRAALKLLLADRTSAANWVSVKFLGEYGAYEPAVEPADFDACPVLLTQPAADRWTPYELSRPVLNKITKVPVKCVMLENAGHYPLEEPGLTQMRDAIINFIRSVAH